jgi:hypothetical protein
MTVILLQNNIQKDVLKKIQKKRIEFEAHIREIDAEAEKYGEKLRKDKALKPLSIGTSKDDAAKILAEVEANRIIRNKEKEKLDLEYEAKFKAQNEARRINNEKANAEAARLAAEEAAKAVAAQAEQERQKKLEIQRAAEQERRKQEQEELRKKKEEHEALLKLEAQRLIEESKKEQPAATALHGLILKEDCAVYERCTLLIQKYEEASKDIIPGSTDLNIKKFYTGAVGCINTPLNAVADTDSAVLSQRVKHFLDMIEGKPVVGNTTMTSHFQCTGMLVNTFFEVL